MPQKHKELSGATRNYFMQNVKNIEEMENFLITYKITNLNQEETENLSRQIKSDGIYAVIKSPKNTNIQDLMTSPIKSINI